MARRISICFFWLLFLSGIGVECYSQGKLYTARGYWEESKKAEYLDIKQKLSKGDSLTENEKNYVLDYDTYLSTYYQRMSEEDKQDYVRLKETWDHGSTVTAVPTAQEKEKEYEWRGRDRLANGLYGLYYGATVSVLTDAEGAAAGAIPLITGGLWMLGPALNPKKYEGLSLSTVRASNSGKLLGAVYGGALGLAVGGNTGSESSAKWILGLSSAGSIALGEIGFQLQRKKKAFYPGQIEMMRHYGFLGPWVGLTSVTSTGSENSNLDGAAIFAGGIAGLIIGNHVARKYEYTRGDVDAVSSLSIISTGIGLAAVGSLNNSDNSRALILIPGMTSIVGTIWGQRAVHGLHLTDKQGSTLNLSTAGSALVGFGIVALTKSSSPAVVFGVPSGLALLTHQLLLHNFKMKNLEVNLRGSTRGKNNFKLAVQVTPESYFLNQRISPKGYSPSTYSSLQNPLVRIKLTF